MRNRAYRPDQGRFLQADPNATGMVINSSPLANGQVSGTYVMALDMQLLYHDGPSVYLYVGANPWVRADPTGLMFRADDLVDVVFKTLHGGVGSMIEQYAANLESDVDWASDWGQGDDWHSRIDDSWVTRSFAAGVVGGFSDAMADMFGVDAIKVEDGAEMAVASTWGNATRVLRGAKAIRKYNMIRGALPGFTKTWIEHGIERAEFLKRRAVRVPQGWFKNRVQTERMLSRLDMSKGSGTIALPKGMAEVAMPGGRIVPATRMRILTTSTRGGKMRLDHAYPMP